MSAPPRDEFARPVTVGRILAGETVHDVVATEHERQALGERLGVLGIDSLSARLRLSAERDDEAVRVSGSLSADVIQSCVITLEPVHAHVEATFERAFVASVPRSTAGEAVLANEADEPPDPLIDDALDLGEIVAEELAIQLDPFPRASGAEFRGYSSEGRGASAAVEHPPANKPFSRLRELLERSK